MPAVRPGSSFFRHRRAQHRHSTAASSATSRTVACHRGIRAPPDRRDDLQGGAPGLHGLPAQLHDLDELGRRCAWVAPDIGPLVRLDAPDRERLAALLRAAYVDARYSFEFEVSREDLEPLAQYVSAFRACAERACRERFKIAAKAEPVRDRR